MFYLAIGFFAYTGSFGPSAYAPDGIGLRHVLMTATFTHGLMPDEAPSEAEHVDRAVKARRSFARAGNGSETPGRRGEDRVDLDIKRERHIVTHRFEQRGAQKMSNVCAGFR
jgi:hypothetical protein